MPKDLEESNFNDSKIKIATVSDPNKLLGDTTERDFIKHAALKSTIPAIQNTKKNNTFRIKKATVTVDTECNLKKTLSSVTSLELKTVSHSPIRNL